MLNNKLKQKVKDYLIQKKHIVGEWEFEKTKIICNKNEFREVMFEVIQWEQSDYSNGKTLSDNSLIHTIL